MVLLEEADYSNNFINSRSEPNIREFKREYEAQELTVPDLTLKVNFY